MKQRYFDYAAATPIDLDVLTAMQPYLTTEFYNPSATYLAAKKVRAAVDDARARTAKVLAVRPREIIFTAGATEANNMAIHGVMAKYPNGKLLVSAIEHDSVLKAAKQHDHAIIPVDKDGLVKPEEFKKLLTDDVVLVSVMYVNNEIGTVNHPIIIAKLIAEAKAKRIKEGNFLPIYFHTDAAQAPNCMPLFAKDFKVDLMSLNGGKIYGPKQSGALFIATGTEIEPIIQGGGQEFGLRSGTENVAGIVGFSHALEKAVDMRHAEEKRMSELRQHFYKELKARLPQVEITAPGAGLYNVVHIVVPGKDNERLMMELDEKGIMCAVGSACSASSDEPSHVLKAIGMSDDQAQSSLRFSMGRQTTKADIDAVISALVDCV